MKSSINHIIIACLSASLVFAASQSAYAQKNRKSRFQSQSRSALFGQNTNGTSSKTSQQGNNSRLSNSNGSNKVEANPTLPKPQPATRGTNNAVNANPFSQNQSQISNRFRSRMKSRVQAVQIVEQANQPPKADAYGRVTQAVNVGNTTMIRRRYSKEALQRIVDSGVLTREQAERANAIGRSEVDRLMATVGTGAIMGASDKVVNEAIENELNSKGARGVANNKAFIDAIKGDYNLPNIQGQTRRS